MLLVCERRGEASLSEEVYVAGVLLLSVYGVEYVDIRWDRGFLKYPLDFMV
jgi:hypothetical protein